jgi:hypothetical protein
MTNVLDSAQWNCTLELHTSRNVQRTCDISTQIFLIKIGPHVTIHVKQVERRVMCDMMSKWKQGWMPRQGPLHTADVMLLGRYISGP